MIKRGPSPETNRRENLCSLGSELPAKSWEETGSWQLTNYSAAVPWVSLESHGELPSCDCWWLCPREHHGLKHASVCRLPCSSLNSHWLQRFGSSEHRDQNSGTEPDRLSLNMQMYHPENHFFLIFSNSRWAVRHLWKVLTREGDINTLHLKEKPTRFFIWLFYLSLQVKKSSFTFSN